jgi:hypothetical protein
VVHGVSTSRERINTPTPTHPHVDEEGLLLKHEGACHELLDVAPAHGHASVRGHHDLAPSVHVLGRSRIERRLQQKQVLVLVDELQWFVREQRG